jgi:hypothetical protein
LFKVLRPFSGLLICLSLSLPWWLLLQERIRTLGLNIGGTQLSGSLFEIASFRELLGFFYVSRLLDFLLPVTLLLPFLFVLNRKRSVRFTGCDRLLFYIVMTFIVIFTFAGHQRSRYVLPLLPLVSLLLAAVTNRSTGMRIPDIAWKVLFGIEAFSLLVFPSLLIAKQQYAPALLLFVTGFLLVYLLRREMREPYWRDFPLSAGLMFCFLLVPVFFAGYNTTFIRSDRISNRDFSLSVGNTLRSSDMLVALGEYPPVLPYYSRHAVFSVRGLDDLEHRYNGKGKDQECYLVVQQGELADVKKVFETTTLMSAEGTGSADKGIVLTRISNVRR